MLDENVAERPYLSPYQDLKVQIFGFWINKGQENNATILPYPKPTQVRRSSRPRRRVNYLEGTRQNASVTLRIRTTMIKPSITWISAQSRKNCKKSKVVVTQNQDVQLFTQNTGLC